MIRVLLVDDELSVLNDVQEMLTYGDSGWEVQIAQSGEQALSKLDGYEFDVLIADLKMPGMDGAELLAIVRDQHPDVMRILMSANSDTTFTSRLVPQAHQFLHKPCQPSIVREMVGRAWELGQRLASPDLRTTLGAIEELPRPPQSVLRLNALLDDPEADMGDVAEVVEQDVALTAKLFQLVNSASYGLNREVTNVRDTVSYLGMNTVRNLAISVEVLKSVTRQNERTGALVQEIHEHSVASAEIARQLMLVREQANEAFVAALLHDVGLLALVSYFPAQFEEILNAAKRLSLSPWEFEIEIIGATHADIGAYLLNLWGLPYPVVEAVARHHDAMMIPHRRMDPAHAVCIADSIVTSQYDGLLFNERCGDTLESSYLEELGVLERVAGLLAVHSAGSASLAVAGEKR